jgi:hypothetical protein
LKQTRSYFLKADMPNATYIYWNSQTLVVADVSWWTLYRHDHAFCWTNPAQSALGAVGLAKVEIESTFRALFRFNVAATWAVVARRARDTCMLSVWTEVAGRAISYAIWCGASLVADHTFLAHRDNSFLINGITNIFC